MKGPNLRFCGEREHMTVKSFILFLIVNAANTNLVPM